MWWMAWVGCNGVPELDETASLNSLESHERMQLCEDYAIEDAVRQSCSVLDVAVGPLEEATCAARWVPDACPATVGEWRRCQEAIAADPCALIERHSACRPLEECGVHLWAAGLGLDGDVELSELAGDEVQAACEAGNQFDRVQVSCIDFLDPLPFDPDEEDCRQRLDDAQCGTIADYLDCQLALLDDVEAAVCRQELDPACAPLFCL